MHNFLFIALLAAPSIAAASPDGAAPPTGLAGIITAVAAVIVSITALVKAIRGDKRATAAKTQADLATTKATDAVNRAQSAADWADRIANAQQDGVVLVLSYPGTQVSCRGLLETNGWRVAFYAMTQTELDEGRLLPGPHAVGDVMVADAIVVEGLDEASMARLAALRDFRDSIRSGCGVALYTGGPNRRYDLTLWSECDQGCTMPVTAEAAVRASLARREATARRQGIQQGIRHGQLADARQRLVG